jgi:hypothetical protein
LSTKKLIITLSIFAIALIVGFIFQIDRENKLKNNQIAKAIVIKKDNNHVMGYGVHVRFKVRDEEHVSKTPECDCSMLDIGDTILIKYSIENPKIFKVVDKYYMQKYKEKK